MKGQKCVQYTWKTNYIPISFSCTLCSVLIGKYHKITERTALSTFNRSLWFTMRILVSGSNLNVKVCKPLSWSIFYLTATHEPRHHNYSSKEKKNTPAVNTELTIWDWCYSSDTNLFSWVRQEFILLRSPMFLHVSEPETVICSL